jgi:hypothetical protein
MERGNEIAMYVHTDGEGEKRKAYDIAYPAEEH